MEKARMKKKVVREAAWEGGVIGMTSVFFPFMAGVMDKIFGFSHLNATWWLMVLPGAILFAIGVIPFVLSIRVVMGSDELVTDGIYAHTRHPHYLSNILWGFSCAFLFGSWWSLFIVFVSLPFIYLLIRREEARLLRIYGKEYEQYKRKVPMILPKIR